MCKNPKLQYELIPKHAVKNLRTELSSADWDMIRFYIYNKNNRCCEVCGEQGDKHPVECHERWEFIPETQTQRLIELVALCPNCHLATHFGYANLCGKTKVALRKLRQVNGWTKRKALLEFDRALEYRGDLHLIHSWKLDLTYLVQIRAEVRKYKEQNKKVGSWLGKLTTSQNP